MSESTPEPSNLPPAGSGGDAPRGPSTEPFKTLWAAEQVLARGLRVPALLVRGVAIGVTLLLLCALAAVPALFKSDCDRLGDLIVESRHMSRNEMDDHAGEFSQLLHRCSDSDDPLPDEYFTG